MGKPVGIRGPTRTQPMQNPHPRQPMGTGFAWVGYQYQAGLRGFARAERVAGQLMGPERTSGDTSLHLLLTSRVTAATSIDMGTTNTRYFEVLGTPRTCSECA